MIMGESKKQMTHTYCKGNRKLRKILKSCSTIVVATGSEMHGILRRTFIPPSSPGIA
jgi:hypothetical protein